MITIVGLGPGEFDRVSAPARYLLLDPARTVVVRTEHHPSARQLGDLRDVVFCDDLYESGGTFEDVYEAIASRVLEASKLGHVVYAVPGSPMVGEFAVRRLLATNLDIEMIPGESFVDAILTEVEYDPLDRGLQILNGHHLADPLVLDKPTIIGQLDRPEILADVCASVDRVTVEGTKVKVLVGLGANDAVVAEFLPEDVDSSLAGLRTSIFIDAEPGGLLGAVRTMRRLRTECPWDKDQTHRSLIKNLVEESYELIDAISRLDEDTSDLVAYAEVEDELGDVLLQVLFHSVIAREKGVFDIDDVAEVMRQKLVRRHPHVFGDVQVASAAEVKANWDRIKKEERGETGEESALDGVPAGMPGLHRAAKIQNRAAKAGFNWDESNEELGELLSAMSGATDVEAELGDVLFSVVDLSRQLGLDAEVALRRATDRFEDRFRHLET